MPNDTPAHTRTLGPFSTTTETGRGGRIEGAQDEQQANAPRFYRGSWGKKEEEKEGEEAHRSERNKERRWGEVESLEWSNDSKSRTVRRAHGMDEFHLNIHLTSRRIHCGHQLVRQFSWVHSC